ncbi:MAG: YgaP family membrane protein [Kiritimatiellia bacterium]
MKIVTKIRLVAVCLVLLSWALGRYGNPAWLWIAALIGVNIFQSAFSGFSPAETFFKAITRSKNAATME